MDVVEHFLDRIERRDDEINAFVTVCDETARDAAAAAERIRPRTDPYTAE